MSESECLHEMAYFISKLSETIRCVFINGGKHFLRYVFNTFPIKSEKKIIQKTATCLNDPELRLQNTVLDPLLFIANSWSSSCDMEMK